MYIYYILYIYYIYIFNWKKHISNSNFHMCHDQITKDQWVMLLHHWNLEKITYEYVNENVTCQAPYHARIMHNPYIYIIIYSMIYGHLILVTYIYISILVTYISIYQ